MVAVQRMRLWGQGGGQQPGGVGVEVRGGQVGQAGAGLEVADGRFADGVAAMVLLQLDRRPDAVGDEGVIAPAGLDKPSLPWAARSA
jgi:hypothetical protein